MPLVYPVIHHLTMDLSLQEGAQALKAGADGVFLISHRGRDSELLPVATELRLGYGKFVGANFLSMGPVEAYELGRMAGLDGVWVDDCGVYSLRTEEDLKVEAELAKVAAPGPGQPALYASVAFKYQREEPLPGWAARRVALNGWIPTTSGPATGQPPSVDKIREMAEELNGKPLAIASGMTPENVRDYVDYASCFLVATGISRDPHHLDPSKLDAFLKTVKG